MSITLNLDDSQTKLLNKKAKQLGVSPQDLAAAAVIEMLTQTNKDFENVANYVVKKNDELYQRLG